MARLLLTVAAYLASAAKQKTVVVVVSRARSGTDFLVSMLNDADEVCVKDETLRELGVDWWDQRAAAGLSEEEVERDHLLRVREKLDMVSSGDFRKPYRRRRSSPCRSDNVTASPPRGPSTRLRRIIATRARARSADRSRREAAARPNARRVGVGALRRVRYSRRTKKCSDRSLVPRRRSPGSSGSTARGSSTPTRTTRARAGTARRPTSSAAGSRRLPRGCSYWSARASGSTSRAS